MAIPEIKIKPNADPARSALYTEGESVNPVVLKVSSRKIRPVINAGKKPDNKITATERNPLFIPIIRL